MSLLVVGADHGGYAVKEDLKKAAAEAGWQIQDVGTNSTEAVDYPDFAVQVGLQVVANPGSLGLMVDGAGVGSAIAANKVPGVRAAVCNDLYTAKNAREHNHANVLCLGSMVVGQGVAREILKIFLTTKPGGDRHERRVNKIRQFEEAHSGAGAAAGLVERVVRLVVEALAGAPAGSGANVLSLIGGVGGSITMLSYNYWMREEGMRGSGFLSYVRGDIAIAYLFTAVFGMSIMLIANDAFFTAGVSLTNAQAVPRMAEALGNVLGTFGRIAFSVGFWAAVFASLLGVWQSVPYLYADLYGIVTKMTPEQRLEAVKVTSKPYRLALVFISLVPIPFAFTGQPIEVVITYTIVSSLFVPFVAATVLYLNNRVKWSEAVPHNSLITNLLLIGILVLFAIVGYQEVAARF